MKRQSLNIDRVGITKQTDNHIKVFMFNLEFDYSYEKLFSVTIRHADGSSTVICRDMKPDEVKHCGQHFNTLEPNKKHRLPYRNWKKACNGLLQGFKLDFTEVEKL